MLNFFYLSILLTLSQDTFLDYIIFLLSGLVHFMSVLHNTHTETDVLLMCINYILMWRATFALKTIEGSK
jgi:hypothetical protein